MPRGQSLFFAKKVTKESDPRRFAVSLRCSQAGVAEIAPESLRSRAPVGSCCAVWTACCRSSGEMGPFELILDRSRSRTRCEHPGFYSTMPPFQRRIFGQWVELNRARPSLNVTPQRWGTCNPANVVRPPIKFNSTNSVCSQIDKDIERGGNCLVAMKLEMVARQKHNCASPTSK